MDTTLSEKSINRVLRLFNEGKTVREIAADTKKDPKEILLFLTSKGLWSQYCSECKITKCYDCPFLQEIGRPKRFQDRIDFLAKTREGGKS